MSLFLSIGREGWVDEAIISLLSLLSSIESFVHGGRREQIRGKREEREERERKT